MGLMTDPPPVAEPGPMAQVMNAMPAKRRLLPAKPVAVIVAVPKPGLRR